MNNLNQLRIEMNDKGYAIVPGLLSHDSIHQFFSELFKLTKRLAQRMQLEMKDDGDMMAFLHRVIPKIYEAKTEAGGFLYDAMNRHLDLYRIFTDRAISDVATELLAENSDDVALAFTNFQFFISRSGDDRNILGWHQDSGYYAEYAADHASIVAWIPLVDCTTYSGALWVIPGSHKFGRLSHNKNEFGKHKDQAWDQKGLVYLGKECFDESEAVQIEAKAGDVLFMNYDTVHKSGKNTSGKIRFTALSRISNIYGEGYISKYKIW